MVRVVRRGGRIVLVDLIAPSRDVRERFDMVHQLIDPSHVRSFLERELADLLPGGIDELVYADTLIFRLPIEVAFTEQSEQVEVLDVLRAEIRGVDAPTGFDPSEGDDKLMVSFVTCIVQGVRH